MNFNISNFFLWIAITFSFLSYDSILYYKYYSVLTAIVMIAGFLCILFSYQSGRKRDFYSLKENKLTIILFFSLMISSFLSSLITGRIAYSDIVSSISTGLSIIIFFVLIPNRLDDIEKNYKYILFLISSSSVIAILMQNFNLTFGHTQSIPYRMSSIFFDANYFGSMCVVAIFLTIFLIKNSVFEVFLLLINILALYYSNSRGATLALIVAVVVYYLFTKKKNIKFIFVFSLISIFFLVMLILLEEYNFFRIYQGLNSRDFLWQIAFDLISLHPFVGYGKSSIDFLLRNAGALNGSTHNSLLDFTIAYGIINLGIYLLIILTAVIRGMKKEDKRLLVLVFFFLINSNSINMSLGGVGFNSLIFTITLGLINSRCKNVY